MHQDDMRNRSGNPSRSGAADFLLYTLLLYAVPAGAGMATSVPERVGEPAAAAQNAGGDTGGFRPGDELCMSSGAEAIANDRFLNWAIAHHRLALTTSLTP